MSAPPVAGLTERGAHRPLIFLVAGEESGDRLGAALMQAIRARLGPHVAFEGVGGREMRALGLRSRILINDTGMIGLGVLLALPNILRRIRQTAADAVAAQPDVVVLIDSPDFTHRVARRVRRAAPSIPIVNYVSPSVWAWRPGRARSMRAYVDHVLALLPFEPGSHAELGGPACTYVGHPMIERAAPLRPGPGETQRRMSDPPVLLVALGSRPAEIRQLSRLFGDTIGLLQGRGGGPEVVLPTLPHLADLVSAATATWPVRPHIVVDREGREAAFRVARAALAKSGTVTLELAIAGVPMVVAYKVSLFEEIVARLTIKVSSIVLANLVLGERVVPEFVQRACTAEALADALAPLLADTPQRRSQTEAFAKLDAIMQIGRAAPSQRAAEVVLNYVAAPVAGGTGH
jgi:lipid-A-disaccharide synthase